MAYSSGFICKRLTFAKRIEGSQDNFGKSGAPRYEILGTFWGNEEFNKGIKSLREGAFDAYDTVMFRLRYNPNIDRWCLVKYQDKWYQITSFNSSYNQNMIQITAVELANQQVNIGEDSSSDI